MSPLRALGGGPLAGNNLARIAYLDEAGISNRRQEPWLVVAGILVHGDHQVDKVYADLEGVIEKHIPEKYRDGLVLHACEIYGGYGKTFDKRKNPYWTEDKRFALFAELAEIVRTSKFLVASAWIERAKFNGNLELPEGGAKPADETVTAHAVAYCSCLLEIDIWLRKHAKKENCMVIVEDNKNARAAIRYVHRYHQSKKMLLTDDMKPYFPVRRIREDPAFQEKSPFNPLLLSDFISFVIKRGLMNDPWIAPYFDPWRGRIWDVSIAKHGAPIE